MQAVLGQPPRRRRNGEVGHRRRALAEARRSRFRRALDALAGRPQRPPQVAAPRVRPEQVAARPAQGRALDERPVSTRVTLLSPAWSRSVQARRRAATGHPADSTLRGGVPLACRPAPAQLTDGGNALAGGLGQLGGGAAALNDGCQPALAGIAGRLRARPGLSDGLRRGRRVDAARRRPGRRPPTVRRSSSTARSSCPTRARRRSSSSGEETAQDYGVKYAVLTAGAERASTEGMAYGAPQGAVGATAYSIEIAGATARGASSLGRLILAIVLFAGGAGIATFVAAPLGLTR